MTEDHMWTMGELAMWVHLLKKRSENLGSYNGGNTFTSHFYQTMLDLEIEKYQTKHQNLTLDEIAAEVDKIRDYTIYTEIGS